MRLDVGFAIGFVELRRLLYMVVLKFCFVSQIKITYLSGVLVSSREVPCYLIMIQHGRSGRGT